MNRIYVGYARVSTREQNEERQIIALTEYGVPKARIYTDKVSGKDFERKNYKRMLKKLKRGNNEINLLDAISLKQFIDSTENS